MKKRTLSLLIALLCCGIGHSYAQTAKHLHYDISIISDNPQMQSMFSGSQMDMYYNGSSVKTDMKMGSMMNMTYVVNAKTQKVLMLMSGMMGKIAMTPDLNKLKEKKEAVNGHIKVQLVDSTKKIAGFNCKEAIITLNPDNSGGMKMALWYTTDISMGDLSAFSYQYKGVPGVPIEFSSQKGPMTMKFTVTKYEKAATVAPDFFSMKVPEGYELKTMDELQSRGK